jgi:mono/diheme cytochrome c family protein
VKEGVPTPKAHPTPMPPMGGAQLSEDQVRAVATYIFSLSHGG